MRPRGNPPQPSATSSATDPVGIFKIDHVIIVNESHLRRVHRSYLFYYHRSRTHLGLDKDTPDRRPVADTSVGPVIAVPEVGGLHHRYERRAA